MYTKLMKQIPTKHDKYKNMKTWISMKYARFQFKVCHDVDKVIIYIILIISDIISLKGVPVLCTSIQIFQNGLGECTRTGQGHI